MKIPEMQEKRRPRIRYDLLGTTAIIEFKGTRSSEIKAGKVLMRFDKRIETVLAKAGPVSGRYRTRKLRYVCGKRKYAVQYRENGCVFSFDPRKAFFSSRLSFERSRILNASKDNEKTMVMFAGIGPFAIEIGKKNKNSEIVAIEINPYACSSMRKNIRINKIHNVKVDCGDVKKLAKKYPDFADRIIMPLPWSSLEFLDDALRVSKKKATVHLYVFGNKEELPDSAWGMIKEHAKKNDYKASMLFSRAVRTYSASEIEMVIDYAIKKK